MHLRSEIGTLFVVLGHMVSNIGCRIRGYHHKHPTMPWYCVYCGRRIPYLEQAGETA